MVWTAPAAVASGGDLTAAFWNEQVYANLNAIGDPWTTYAGGNTNLTIGNGTLSKRYMQAGKTIRFSIELTFGSTTSITSVRFGLPFAPRLSTNGSPKGQASLLDTSAAARRQRFVVWIAADSGVAVVDGDFTGTDATTPWTWATGDTIVIDGAYEAA